MAKGKWANLPSKDSNPYAQTVDPSEYGIRGVLQFGRCHVLSARESALGLHAHDCLQITICARKTMTFTGNNGEVWSMLPGRMLVMPPGTQHNLVLNTHDNLRYWLFFPKAAGARPVVDGLSKAESRWLLAKLHGLELGMYTLPDSAMRMLEGMFDVLGDGDRPAAEKGLRMRAMMLGLLLAVVDAERCVESDDSVVQPIVEMMGRDPGKAYPMEWIASRTKLSPGTITAMFRRKTGKTPHQYLVLCRIRMASDLLCRTDRTVTDIAHTLGFASSQHFASCFRREVGETPRQWRKKARGRQ